MNDQSVLHRFVQGVGDPMAHALTSQAAEAWFAHEAGRQGPSSYNKVLQRVRGLLGFCASAVAGSRATRWPSCVLAGCRPPSGSGSRRPSCGPWWRAPRTRATGRSWRWR